MKWNGVTEKSVELWIVVLPKIWTVPRDPEVMGVTPVPIFFVDIQIPKIDLLFVLQFLIAQIETTPSCSNQSISFFNVNVTVYDENKIFLILTQVCLFEPGKNYKCLPQP